MRKSRRLPVRARERFSSKTAPTPTTAVRKSKKSRVKKSGPPASARYSQSVHRGEKLREIGRGHFLVKSKSEKGWQCVSLGYVSDEWPEGGCSCEGFMARKTCRHWRVVLDFLGLPYTGPVLGPSEMLDE